MTTVQIQHDVKDFETWKRAFDKNPLRRDRGGVSRYVMCRCVEKPSVLFIQLHFPKREDAEAYLLELERMLPTVEDAVGFGEEPKAWLLEEVEQRAY
jgi:hypothetical protein